MHGIGPFRESLDEKLVLARAVQWHAERRVLLDGNKTVVFR